MWPVGLVQFWVALLILAPDLRSGYSASGWQQDKSPNMKTQGRRPPCVVVSRFARSVQIGIGLVGFEQTTMVQVLRSALDFYSKQHLSIQVSPRKIATPDQETIGYIEEIHVDHEQLYMHGWTLADSIEIVIGSDTHIFHPTLDRNDVASALGCHPNVGFHFVVPLKSVDCADCTFRRGDMETHVRIGLPGEIGFVRASRRYKLTGALELLRHLPQITKRIVTRDPDLRDWLKSKLANPSKHRIQRLDPDFLQPMTGATVLPDGASVTIILPVFNALDMVKTCVSRVVAHTEIPWRLLIIEDCSSDPSVRPWLRAWVKSQTDQNRTVELLENAENLGFIKSVNRGFEYALQFNDPVVLLNSDAFVPKDWASRLLAPIYDDPAKVASVTPLSNDAEIYGAPVACLSVPLHDGQGDKMDDVARQFATSPSPIVAPTGVGFCMAMNPAFLSEIPEFDTVFGRGYGEEVDWCRKAAALGGAHIAATNLFVEHRGGSSFGSAEKQERVAANNAIISKRYPTYDAMVHDFFKADQLLTSRLAVTMGYLDSLEDIDRVPVYIAHSLGGGAETYLKNRIVKEAVDAHVILRFGGVTRCQIEVQTPFGMTTAQTDDLSVVETLMGALRKRSLVYICAVGDRDPASLITFLTKLAKESPTEVHFHDFYPVSPSYTLLDSAGTYHGVPAVNTTDPAHSARGVNRQVTSLAEWRAAWSDLLMSAESLLVFSKSSRDIVLTAFPDVADKIELRPHDLHAPVSSVQSPQNERLVIGVLGDIGQHKGAAIVKALSHCLSQTKGEKLVLLGSIDPAYQPSPDTISHGRYTPSEIPALVDQYGINVWLIPSIWPETFSYTTHECIATGLPVMCFELGAQADAVAQFEKGWLVPLEDQAGNPSELAQRILTTAQHILTLAN